MKKPSKKLILLVGIMLFVSAAVFTVHACLGSGLLDQKAAERWAGDSEQSFTQLTVFQSADSSLDLNGIYEFRTKLMEKLAAEASDEGSSEGLYRDCWSANGKVRISSDKAAGDVSVIAVGGDFFAFHPIPLFDGSYISESSIMKDGVILDEETAWLLFGGTQLSGMSVDINGQPFVVSGVIDRKSDRASSIAYSGGSGIFMSWEAYVSLFKDDSVTCYELVMAEPVEGFAYSYVNESFPHDGGELIENTGRFGFSNSLRIVKDFGRRSMHDTTVAYSYWENAARYIEDWCAVLALIAVLSLTVPAAAVMFYLVSGFVFLRRKVKARLPSIVENARDKAEMKIYSRRAAYSGKHVKK